MEINQQLSSLINDAKKEVASAENIKQLEEKRILFLAKNGRVSTFLSLLKSAKPEERAKLGEAINNAKSCIVELFDQKNEEFKLKEMSLKEEREAIDISIPGKKFTSGSKHPIQIVNDYIIDILTPLGFSIEEGYEVEDDLHNFQMLNIPIGHPARDMQDTFYINQEQLLRTHTSPSQVRALLLAKGAPVKIICPGKVYRKDDDDATHSHQFNQIEGLVVDKNVTMADLKGILEYLIKQLFGSKRQIRLRSSFFGFTEPSIEVDVSCFNCDGKGCNICKGTGYIEVLGAGMIHPNVLRSANYDPEIYQGYAFGIGADRIAMLKYGINDIRELFLNDLRFLEQFKKERK